MKTKPSDGSQTTSRGAAEPSKGAIAIAAGATPTLRGSGAEEWAETRAEREALPAKKLVRVYAKVLDAVGQARLGAGGAAKYAAGLAALPLPADPIGRVRLYAAAALRADIAWVTGVRPKNELPALVAELKTHRPALLAIERMLLARGIFRPRIRRLRKPKNSRGYLALVTEISVLATRLDQEWARVGNRIPLTRAELDAILLLAERTGRAIAARPRRSDDRKALRLDRQRAFTLLDGAYHDLRRGLGFLLWDRKRGYDAVDDVAPPLAAGINSRWKRKRREAKRLKTVEPQAPTQAQTEMETKARAEPQLRGRAKA